MTDVVGGVLVAGLVVFLVGAVAWRLDYERPLAESLPLIHADRRRRAWIQTWMLVAMFVTTAGVAGFAAVPDEQRATLLAVMAASVYALGAVCMIVSLAFGLTVVPWAAERTVADGSIPEGFAAYRSWTSGLYVIHMVASYVAFAVLGAAVLASRRGATLGRLGRARTGRRLPHRLCRDTVRRTLQPAVHGPPLHRPARRRAPRHLIDRHAGNVPPRP